MRIDEARQGQHGTAFEDFVVIPCLGRRRKSRNDAVCHFNVLMLCNDVVFVQGYVFDQRFHRLSSLPNQSRFKYLRCSSVKVSML